jgi:hypothetical protein
MGHKRRPTFRWVRARCLVERRLDQPGADSRGSARRIVKLIDSTTSDAPVWHFIRWRDCRESRPVGAKCVLGSISVSGILPDLAPPPEARVGRTWSSPRAATDREERRGPQTCACTLGGQVRPASPMVAKGSEVPRATDMRSSWRLLGSSTNSLGGRLSTHYPSAASTS